MSTHIWFSSAARLSKSNLEDLLLNKGGNSATGKKLEEYTIDKAGTRDQNGPETMKSAMVTNQMANVTKTIVTDQKLQETRLEPRFLKQGSPLSALHSGYIFLVATLSMQAYFTSR